MNDDIYLKKNLGRTDRSIRSAVAAALIVYPGMASWPAWWIPVLAAIGGMQLIAVISAY